MRQFHIQKGFNLIELIIVVAVIGIVTAISTPSYQNFIKNQAITSVSSEIIAAFQLARTEAIKRSDNVKVCFNNAFAGEDCVEPEYSTSGGTLNISSIFVFVDENDNDDLDNDEEVIYTSNPFDERVELKQSLNYNIGKNILFNQKGGATLEADTSRTAAYIAICDDRELDHVGRLLTINTTGRVSITGLTSTAKVGCT